MVLLFDKENVMLKIIEFNGKRIELRSSAATRLRYKQTFHKEIQNDLKIINSDDDLDKIAILDTLTQLSYVMNKQAKGEKDMNYDNYEEWLDSMEESFFLEKANEIISTWLGNNPTSQLKNA